MAMTDVENLSQQIAGTADWVSQVGRATGSKRVRRKSKRLSSQMSNVAERLVDVTNAAAGRPRRRKGVSGQLANLRERMEDAVDAAKDSRHRPGPEAARWLLVPAAAGVVVYASARSGLFSRGSKQVIQDTAARAAELPNDLLDTVRSSSQQSSKRSPAQRRRKTQAATRTRARSTAKSAGRSGSKTSTSGRTKRRNSGS